MMILLIPKKTYRSKRLSLEIRIMNSGLIYRQHLYLRLAIFFLGIATGLEASLRQLLAQGFLFLVYLSFECQLLGKLLFALRKLITFLAAYWIFALLFQLEFLHAVDFSLKIIYLVIITVAAWGAVDKQQLLAQCSWCHYSRTGRAFMGFVLATYFFIRSYFEEYKLLSYQDSIAGIIDRAILAGKRVHKRSSAIEIKTELILQNPPPRVLPQNSANIFGLAFLSVLVVISSL
jgi:hypothetical protein